MIFHTPLPAHFRPIKICTPIVSYVADVRRNPDSCTLSVVMLSWFGPREPLPGRGTGGYYEQSDTATFRDIWLAARVVERDCLLPTRRPGWEVVGETPNMFFFDENKVVAQQLTPCVRV